MGSSAPEPTARSRCVCTWIAGPSWGVARPCPGLLVKPSPEASETLVGAVLPGCASFPAPSGSSCVSRPRTAGPRQVVESTDAIDPNAASVSASARAGAVEVVGRPVVARLFGKPGQRLCVSRPAGSSCGSACRGPRRERGGAVRVRVRPGGRRCSAASASGRSWPPRSPWRRQRGCRPPGSLRHHAVGGLPLLHVHVQEDVGFRALASNPVLV